MDFVEEFKPKGSSKLAALFGQPSVPADASLTFTPPKQPEAKSAKAELIIVKKIHAFVLENDSYRDLGQLGLSLVGCGQTSFYKLILYRNQKDILCTAKITQQFNFTLSENYYASFNSDANKQFSVRFPNSNCLREFAFKVAEIRALVWKIPEVISQDIEYSKSKELVEGSQYLAKIDPYCFLNGQLKRLEENKEIVLTFDMKQRIKMPFLVGCNDFNIGTVRIIISPQEYSAPWEESIPKDGKLFVILQMSELPTEVPLVAPPADEPLSGEMANETEIPNEASENKAEQIDTNDVSFTNGETESVLSMEATDGMKNNASNSQKANLLSRMARLGRPALPIKPVVDGSSLSESDSEKNEHDGKDSKKKPRPSVLKRDFMTKRVEVISNVTVPLNSPTLQDHSMNNELGSYLPLNSSDASLSSHLSASRLEHAEIRMGISKVNDKIDLINSKIDQLNISRSRSPVDSALNSDIAVAGLQNIIKENQTLKAKVAEGDQRIEELNSRISQLLDIVIDNQNKCLETSTSTIKGAMDVEPDSANSNAALKQAMDRVSFLECENASLSQNLHRVQGDLASANWSLDEQRVDVEELRSNLASVVEENENLKKNEARLTLSLTNLEEKLKTELENLSSSMKFKEEEIKKIKKEQLKQIKSLIDEIYKKLVAQFQANVDYTGVFIQEILGFQLRTIGKEAINRLKSSPSVEVPPLPLFDGDQGTD